MKLHLHKKQFSSEEQAELLKQAKEANDLFTERLIPFYNQKVLDAVKAGWKMQIGVSHYWLEHPLGLRVMLGGGEYNSQVWAHFSASYKDEGRLIRWKEFSKAKDTFLGEETLAIQIFPPRSQWVNDRNNVLHLWVNLDVPVFLPDFRIADPRKRGGLSI